MSVECSECEWDARAGHDPDCSRSPEQEVKRYRAALERIRDLAKDAFLTAPPPNADIYTIAASALSSQRRAL